MVRSSDRSRTTRGFRDFSWEWDDSEIRIFHEQTLHARTRLVHPRNSGVEFVAWGFQRFIRTHNETLSVTAIVHQQSRLFVPENQGLKQPQLQPALLRLPAMISQDFMS
jgi:hypothetical protein